jgi:hypothetical protein
MEYTTFLARSESIYGTYKLINLKNNIFSAFQHLKTYEYVDNKSFLNVIGFHFIVGRRAVAY